VNRLRGKTALITGASQGLGRQLALDFARAGAAGLVLAGVAGGLGWAVGLPVAAAVGIGAAVFGVKVLSGSLMDRRPATLPGELPVRSHSTEAWWLERAERAARSFRGLSGSAQPGPIAERLGTMSGQVDGTLDGVRRLAGQASAVGDALGRIDAQQLADEAGRLEAQGQAATDDEVRGETARSLDSVQEQLNVYRRLEEAAAKIQARMESGVLGLEGLVARLVEVLALVQTQSPVEGAQRIDALADELEGLRSGLAETESLSRRVLSAYRGQGSLEPGTSEPGARGGRIRWRSKERGGRDAEAS
jgi:NAD(P)-dependent dehydrogenase (short-subunit alcohol dehydrogenase family)